MTSSNKKRFRSIYVEITNACNLTCPFCPNAGEAGGQYIDVDSFTHIIKNIASSTEKVYLHVTGEPLLHPHLQTLLAICTAYQVPVRITTNGTLLHAQKEILLGATCLTKVNISLQSAITLSEAARNVYTKQLLQFMKQKIALRPDMALSLRMWNNKADSATQSLNEMFSEAFALLIQENLGKRLDISQEDEFIWPSLAHPVNPIPAACFGGKQQLAILVDGTVVLCCLDYQGKTAIGNIYQDNWQTLIQGELLKRIVQGWQHKCSVMSLCQHCSYRNRFVK